MARKITIPGIWAENAETDIPINPVPGIAYRNLDIDSTEFNIGQRYKKIVDSSILNQLLYTLTHMVRETEQMGVLEWSDLTDYKVNSLTMGLDGFLYQAIVPSGPANGGAKPPPNTYYWKTALGGDNTSSGITLITASQTYTVEHSGWYLICVVGGGGGGGSRPDTTATTSGGAGGFGMLLRYMTKGEVFPIIIGAGGIGANGLSPSNYAKGGGATSIRFPAPQHMLLYSSNPYIYFIACGGGAGANLSNSNNLTYSAGAGNTLYIPASPSSADFAGKDATGTGAGDGGGLLNSNLRSNTVFSTPGAGGGIGSTGYCPGIPLVSILDFDFGRGGLQTNGGNPGENGKQGCVAIIKL